MELKAEVEESTLGRKRHVPSEIGKKRWIPMHTTEGILNCLVLIYSVKQSEC